MRTVKRSGWVSMPDGTERHVSWIKGFDCRGGCTLTCPHANSPKGNYGQACDELELTVRWPVDEWRGGSFEEAANLVMFTNVRDGLVAIDGIRRISPAVTSLHTSYRTQDGDVRDNAIGEACYMLRAGRCFGNEETGCLVSERIWTEADTDAVSSFLATAHEHLDRLLKLDTGMWERLTAWGHPRRLELRATHNALPRRCSTCAGKGVVPKGNT